MATIDVLDAVSATVALEKPNANGRAAAASSRPVALSDEDKAALDSIDASLSAAATSIPHTATDTTSDLTHGFSSSSSSGERTLVAAVAAQTTRIYRMTITAAAATVIELRDGAAGSALKTIEFPAAGAYVYDFDPRPYVKTTANTALILNSTVATKTTIDFGYLTSA